MYFLSGINTKKLWDIPEENYFPPLRILNLFIKSFVNPFLDIAWTFFDSSANSFLTSIGHVLLEVIILFKCFRLSSKFYDICADLAAKVSDVNFLNSGVVIYLS